MKVESFNMSPSDVAMHKNHAVGELVDALIRDKFITNDQATEIVETYLFVPVRQNMVLSIMKKWLFSGKVEEGTFIFPLTRISK